MFLIYGKNKVGQAVASLCDYLGIAYEMRDDSDDVASFEPYDAIIPSPGIPGTHRIYATGKVICELDFAYQHLPAGFRISAVTGTDGKSTTTWMLYSILEKEFSGKKSVYISGNFDVPFSATVLQILQKGEKKGEIVVEVSSFMAYWIGGNEEGRMKNEEYAKRIRKYSYKNREGKTLPPSSHLSATFSPDYTIFTNLKTDHQNWHRDLQEYLDAKMNLARHTRGKVILNHEVVEFAEEKGLTLELPENVRIFDNQTKGGERAYSLIGTSADFQKSLASEVEGLKLGQLAGRNSKSPELALGFQTFDNRIAMPSARNDNIQYSKNPTIQQSNNPTIQPSNNPYRDWTDGEDIAISGRRKYRLSETNFSGVHNAMNLLSVAMVTNEMKICSKRMKRYLADITGLPHRLEKIAEKNGIIFVEDSKSTSAQSLEAALGSYAPMNNEQGTMKNTESMEGDDTVGQFSLPPYDKGESEGVTQRGNHKNVVHPYTPLSEREQESQGKINIFFQPKTPSSGREQKNLLLIVGGSDKGDTFAHLSSKFALRVKAMVCIGATKAQFVAIAQREQIPFLETDSMMDAVNGLYERATSGDVLMLSPGCASFGLFRDYLDRANQFRDAVKNIAK